MEDNIIKFRKLQYRPAKILQLNCEKLKIPAKEKQIWFVYWSKNWLSFCFQGNII